MVLPVLSENSLNKIKSLFIKETTGKIATVRSKMARCDHGKEFQENFRDIYVIFHSLKGTGRSIGFDEITNIAADALEITQKIIDNEISLKLFKAKIEANLCEIEEILPPDFVETGDEEINTGTTLGTVLVVDDDVSLTRAIKERLTLDGFKVLTATSLSEAASYLDLRQPFDLMIIDIIMPEGSGFDLCQAIRKENSYEDTPIIFLTAETSLDNKLKSFEIGADDYIVKPVSLDEIAAKARATFNRNQRYKIKLLHDDLTGAYNRLFLQEKFFEEKARSQRNKKSFSLCLLDLDCFKNINDSYGHQAGDQILVQFTEFLKLRTRPTDAVIRFGGEEFILILSQIERNKAVEIMNRLRASFSGHVFDINGENISVTFSAGIAAYPENGDSLEDLLSSADSALYKAKQSGRNRVCGGKGVEHLEKGFNC